MLDSKTGLDSLNPCFSGTYSRRGLYNPFPVGTGSLNPCFSGTYSRRLRVAWPLERKIKVLILVLVEHTLGAWSTKALNRRDDVLILVLVEHTLGGAGVRYAKQA